MCWLVKYRVSKNTELAQAVDVMMAQAKRIYILIIKVIVFIIVFI